MADSFTSHSDLNPIYAFRKSSLGRSFVTDPQTQKKREFTDPFSVLALLGYPNLQSLEADGYYTISKKELEAEK